MKLHCRPPARALDELRELREARRANLMLQVRLRPPLFPIIKLRQVAQLRRERAVDVPPFAASGVHQRVQYLSDRTRLARGHLPSDGHAHGGSCHLMLSTPRAPTRR